MLRGQAGVRMLGGNEGAGLWDGVLGCHAGVSEGRDQLPMCSLRAP